MLETLLNPTEHSFSLNPTRFSSTTSVFEQYLSLDPFLIAGTALALYTGYARKRLSDLALPLVVASADNLFSKVVDAQYTFEQFGRDVKMEALFVAGAYLLGLLTSCVTKASSRRRHHFQRS